MHHGKPARILVRLGEYVKKGQPIADADGRGSCNVHSSVSGRVSAIDSLPHHSGRLEQSIRIENNGLDSSWDGARLSSDWRECAPDEVAAFARDAGILADDRCGVPLGFFLDAFVSHKAENLFINLCESDPAESARRSLAVARTADMVAGAAIIRKATGAPSCIFCISESDRDLSASVNQILESNTDMYTGFSVATMKNRFPQDIDVLIARAMLKREIRSCSLAENGIAVVGSEACVNLFDAVMKGQAFCERLVSVSGAGIVNPGVYSVRIGTSVAYLLSVCGFRPSDDTVKVAVGGLMRGTALSELDVPVTRETTSIIVLDKSFPAEQEEWCIRCGACSDVCPMRLTPERIAASVRRRDFSSAAEFHPDYCIMCGACAYVCPSRVNLLNYIGFAAHTTASVKKVDYVR